MAWRCPNHKVINGFVCARDQSTVFFLTSSTQFPFADDVDGDADELMVSEDGPSDTNPQKPPGIPDPYYPIALPIDQQFKAKYAFHHRRGKTFQERLYVFLEHPVGWYCFTYHVSV